MAGPRGVIQGKLGVGSGVWPCYEWRPFDSTFTYALPMSVLVAGTIAIDHVKTPDAEASDLLGGSASYAALSAALLGAEAHLIGIVGHDYPQKHLDMLRNEGVLLAGVEHSDGESFSWSGEYFDDLNKRVTHRVALNVLEDWQPKVPDSARDCELVVLANMSPDNQLSVLEQCQKPSFVVADTMDLWIEIATARLHDVLQRIDLFVINDSEARELAGVRNLVLAGEKLLDKGPEHVVIKLGEYGALLFGPEGFFFRCGAFPLRDVKDPTGAGDSFLGGLAGWLDGQGISKPDFEQLKRAIAYGSVAASFTCEDFSTLRLEDIGREDIEARFKLFRTHSEF